MTPAVAGHRLLCALALGGAAGLWYSILRPLGRRTVLGDLLFLGGFFWAWLILGFCVGGGDLRLGDCTALALGALVWKQCFGDSLEPISGSFWAGCGGAFFSRGKKFSISEKFCLHLGKNGLQ